MGFNFKNRRDFTRTNKAVKQVESERRQYQNGRLVQPVSSGGPSRRVVLRRYICDRGGLVEYWRWSTDSDWTPSSEQSPPDTPAIVTVELTAPATSAPSTFDVDVKFSEEVNGLTVDDFTITNGRDVSLTDLEDFSHYTLQVQANSIGIVNVQLPANTVRSKTNGQTNAESNETATDHTG